MTEKKTKGVRERTSKAMGKRIKKVSSDRPNIGKKAGKAAGKNVKSLVKKIEKAKKAKKGKERG